MARLLGFVTPLTGWMIIAVSMGVLGFLCAIFIPVTAIYLIAQAMDNSYWLAASTLFIFMLVIAVLRGVFHYIEQACNHYIAFKLLAILRDHIFTCLRRLAPAKLEGHDRGNLITLLTSDIELLEVFYAHTVSPITIAFITDVILLALFYMMHPIFAVIALCGYIYVGIMIPIQISKKGKATGAAYRQQAGDLSSYTLASVRGLRDILQFGNGEQRMSEMTQKSKDININQKQLKTFEGSSSSQSTMAVLGFSLLLLFVALSLFQYGSVSFSQVLIATVLLFSSFGPVLALSSLSNNLLITLASGRRIFALLDEAPVVEDIIKKETSEFGDIHLQNISFAYEEEVVLANVSATLETGHIIGIHGKSGSGKSTLLKLLMRFWDVQQGSLTINKHSINEINTSELRNMESYVTQDSVLFHDSIEANIKIAKADATHEEVVEAAKRASIHDFIMSLPNGYATMVSELGDSLSGGERQRIGIARSFLHDSPCLLLDEPTSNLDALNEAVILHSLRQQKGRTIILVSHRLSTLKIANRIIAMQQGRVR